MRDYTKSLPEHSELYIGEKDLFLEIYQDEILEYTAKRPPLLFIHGAYTGSWMWSKYIPHFVVDGWKCYVMNLRGHYRSRSVDLTKVTFSDYLEDIKDIVTVCGEPPVILGFSLGGILSQKIAETTEIKGLILVDSSISMEVNNIAPYQDLAEDKFGDIISCPLRDEISSIDESEEDIIFQKKYLSMESAKVFRECGCWIEGVKGVSIDSSLITCPTLIIKSVNSAEDDRRGRVEADNLKGEYTGYWNTTHTGLLIGQRYVEIVERIQMWLKQF